MNTDRSVDLNAWVSPRDKLLAEQAQHVAKLDPSNDVVTTEAVPERTTGTRRVATLNSTKMLALAALFSASMPGALGDDLTKQVARDNNIPYSPKRGSAMSKPTPKRRAKIKAARKAAQKTKARK